MNSNAPLPKIIAGLALAGALSGCSLIRLPLFGHRPAAKPPAIVTAPLPTGDADTQEGRRLLADGQPGAAIAILQRALGRGEPVAPAINALGIGYARIGRLDLAERYLSEAASLDPADTRYANNLAIIVQAREARERAMELTRERDAMRAAAVRIPAPPALPGRLERISRLEVKIITAPAQAAPLYRSALVANVATPSRPIGANPGLTVKIITAPTQAAPIARSTPAGTDGTALASAATPRLPATRSMERAR
ncbi:hypothetical protein [Sphingobium sp. TCM1]|uniref:hypothetical protein n=1 Tax=Sphingobium sp. TCM1 TaxID=453246 RepID=UPI0007F4439E|nr:hypothetical protein [Sphingobium sp. TCM1]OAN56584.1 hypothetical protein A7Q26_18555 [Sphingobium sp. TCM1]